MPEMSSTSVRRSRGVETAGRKKGGSAAAGCCCCCCGGGGIADSRPAPSPPRSTAEAGETPAATGLDTGAPPAPAPPAPAPPAPEGAMCTAWSRSRPIAAASFSTSKELLDGCTQATSPAPYAAPPGTPATSSSRCRTSWKWPSAVNLGVSCNGRSSFEGDLWTANLFFFFSEQGQSIYR